MDRREFVRLLALAMAPSIATVKMASAQDEQRIAPANAQFAANPQGQAAPPAPVDPRVKAALRMWEAKGSTIERFRGTFERYVYDRVFSVEKRSVGVFIYESPDKGRIDFQAPQPQALPNPPINPKRKNAQGEPFKVVADSPQKWVCTGDKILVIDDSLKTVRKVDIPPQYRGENISDGPLPFLFGVKADQAMNRYELAIGSLHSDRMVHLVAKPKRQNDAREWSQAEVMLDAQSFQPTAIRMFDPGGNAETVYVFDVSKQKINERWLFDPFGAKQLNIGGYQIIEESTAEAPAETQRGGPRSIIR